MSLARMQDFKTDDDVLLGIARHYAYDKNWGEFCNVLFVNGIDDLEYFDNVRYSLACEDEIRKLAVKCYCDVFEITKAALDDFNDMWSSKYGSFIEYLMDNYFGEVNYDFVRYVENQKLWSA